MSHHHVDLNARRWAAVRRAVLKRDGFRCVMCGKSGKLECDHITPLQREPNQDPYDPNDLHEKTRRENRRPLTSAELAWRSLVADLLTER